MGRRLFKIVLTLVFFQLSFSLFSQEVKEEIPSGYHDFIFGDSLETVKDKLQYDSYFAYRGDPDVSMMLVPDKSIIDTEGSGFIERAFFLFHEEKLYQITLLMNRDKIDFYSFQIRFTEKYGEPQSLDPTGMIWESEKYRLSLEYPLSVKFVDLSILNELQENALLRKSSDEVLREDFLDSF